MINIEAGKKYLVQKGIIGSAKPVAGKQGMGDIFALYFPEDESPELPIYYYSVDEGKSNISFISTEYDIVEEVKE